MKKTIALLLRCAAGIAWASEDWSGAKSKADDFIDSDNRVRESSPSWREGC
jgi:hypothetical protein